jgi:FkbM family methyltransferase
MNIPIIIICYNNYKYVENMLKQIFEINQEYYNNIYILDNCSDCPDTVNFLKNTNCKIISNSSNFGPWVNESQNAHIYNGMPSKFILTDPDLEINKNIPSNFIDILSSLSDKYNCTKIGFALDIKDFDKMYQDGNYGGSGNSIYGWEMRFWENKIEDDTYELYQAAVDTTFCLINKNYIHNDKHIRVAGNFTAKHLPWYINNKVYNLYDNYIANKKTTWISTTSKTAIPYIELNYLKITKNSEMFLIKNENTNLNIGFWRDVYANWENETFAILDRFLDKNKIFIDIGGWIGTTAMYGSRKSKHVYSVEADIQAHSDMALNLESNCEKNYTLINKALYHTGEIEVKFGQNKFIPNSTIGDSTSQVIDCDDNSTGFYLIKTITPNQIIKNYDIDPTQISLIKVDIEGAEEFILSDLHALHKNYNIPIYVSFHLDWWKDKNLNRFDFLTQEHKNKIISNPFCSILFN